jgi:hypothetical protein
LTIRNNGVPQFSPPLPKGSVRSGIDPRQIPPGKEVLRELVETSKGEVGNLHAVGDSPQRLPIRL